MKRKTEFANRIKNFRDHLHENDEFVNQYERQLDLKRGKPVSQEKFGKLFNRDQVVISKWESGDSEPNLTDIETMKKVFGRSITRELLELDSINEHGVEEDKVKWIEDIPIILSKEKQREVSLGIRVFNELYCKGKSLSQLDDIEDFREKLPNLADRYRAFRVAILTGGLRFIDIPRNHDYENQIRRKVQEGKLQGSLHNMHKMKEIIVANVADSDGTPIRAEFVAFLTAKHIFGSNDIPGSIAFGPGYTTWRVAQQSIIGNITGQHIWIPLTAFRREWEDFYTSNQIVAFMANYHQLSRGLHLPYRNPDDPSKNSKMWDQVAADVGKTDTAILSVVGFGERYKEGSLDYFSQFRGDDYITYSRTKYIFDELYSRNMHMDVAGEYLGLLYKDNGELIDVDWAIKKCKDAIAQIDLIRVKDITTRGKVWMVASMHYKARAVKMAIECGFANAFVIDNRIAEYVLGLAKTR